MDGLQTKALSPLANEIIAAATYDRLVVNGGAPPKARELLGNVTPEQLLSVPLKNIGHGYSMLAGLWLWHDALHESHEIAQADVDVLYRAALNLHTKRSNSGQSVQPVQSVQIDKDSFRRQIAAATDSLNFWHAIMHRREGDFGNSKYWYARCRNHPAHARIAAAADPVLQQSQYAATAKSFFRGSWSPEALVDLADEAHRKPADAIDRRLAVALQTIEWTGIFQETIREAARI